MIHLVIKKPTDAEYIHAFRVNDNAMMSLFRKRNREKLIAVIKKEFGTFDDDALSRIYQETMGRLWENIQRGKLDNGKLTTSLFAYMKGIAEKVALEFMRKDSRYVHANNEESDVDDYTDDESDDNTGQSFRATRPSNKQVWDEATWIEMVERPYHGFILNNHSEEERLAEWNRLTENYEKAQTEIKKDFYMHYKPEKQTVDEVLIGNIVNNMGKPCEPLLKKFYWDGSSWMAIALELKYSGPDSAKTQKNKCMNKLRKIVELRRNEFSHEYC